LKGKKVKRDTYYNIKRTGVALGMNLTQHHMKGKLP
jgi:hypothetical protein